MSDSIINKKNEITNKKNWVYSLPFFPDLLKRIKVIILIHLAIKNKLIKIIQNQRLNAVSKIITAYKNYKLINQIKKEYFIRKIISERKKAIIKIQNYVKYYLTKLKLKEIIRKEKGSYTIICNKSNVAKISLKIFTDYCDNDKSMILPMKYCPIRKYFILSIPKTKFILAQKDCKIVRFNFIYKGNMFFEEEQYKLVDFNGKKVHEINFSDYDNIHDNLDYKKYYSNIDEDIQGLSYKSHKSPTRQKSSTYNKEPVLDFSSDEENERKSPRKVSKDSNGQKKQNFERSKNKGKTCKLKNPKYLKIISILKERNFDRRKRSYNISNEKRVKFGTVTFSY